MEQQWKGQRSGSTECRGHQSVTVVRKNKQTTNRQTDRQTDRQTGRLTGRQADRQTGRLTDRQTDRQTDMQAKKSLLFFVAVFRECRVRGLDGRGHFHVAHGQDYFDAANCRTCECKDGNQTAFCRSVLASH